MTTRTVTCAKLGIEAEGLATPPFPGELGQSIFNNVSKQEWEMWQDNVMIKVINEYRLDMTNEEDFALLITQMCAFLNLESGIKALEIGNAERGQDVGV